MSNTVWWIFAASIFVALIVSAVAFFVMRAKIKKVRVESGLIADNSNNKALTREDHGMLLWDLRDKTKDPLDDLSMEFAINTVLRNKYKKLYINGFDEKYEETTLIKKTDIKISKTKFDFGLIKFDSKLIDNIDAIIKNQEVNSIIMITHAIKGKDLKSMMSYLKLTGIRSEYQKIDKGIILIAK